MRIDRDEVVRINSIQNWNYKILSAAIMYTERGFYIVPLRPNSKLLPSTSYKISYNSATKNPESARKWFGPGGKFEGYNIGLVCGHVDGIAAIDLDVKDGKNGIEGFFDLYQQEWEKEPIHGPVQRTISGGLHLIVKWRVPFINKVNAKKVVGFDIRGGQGHAPKGHIVAWPSRVDGEEYHWEEFGEVNNPPQWLCDSLGVPLFKTPNKDGRGNEEVTESDIERHHSIEDIQIMLDYINPCDLSYEQWYKIGMAIHSQHPTAAGWGLWDTWNKRDANRYTPDQNRSHWESFSAVDDGGPKVKMGTLVHMATERGFTLKHGPVEVGAVTSIVDEFNKNNALLVLGGKIRIASRDAYNNIHLMSVSDFEILHKNNKLTILGEAKSKSKVEIWLAHENRRECTNGIGFFPGKPLFHEGYVNLFRGWGTEPIQGDWSLMYDHIMNIIASGNEEWGNFIIDWVADIFQNPSKIPGTAVILHGVEGCGKGTLFNILGELCGSHFAHLTHESHLTGNFNYHLMDKVLIFADEVTYGGTKKTAGVLKAIVTETELMCERKGIDSFRYLNCARVGIASNEDWFIPAGPQSRRWFVLDVKPDKANDRDYFGAIYDQMANGGLSAMFYDLLNRKIKSNLRMAPVTKPLLEQRKLWRIANDPIAEWIDECVHRNSFGTMDEASEDGEWPYIVDKAGLYDAYLHWKDDKRIMASNKGSTHFFKKMKEYGFQEFRPSAPDRHGVRRRKYYVPKKEAFTNDEES